MSNKIIHGSMDDLRCELEHTQQALGLLEEKNNNLERQLEDLEDQAEFFKKQCDRFGDESINLECQLEEARELIKQTVNKDCSQCVHNYSNGDGWCGDCNNKLKEKGE